MFECKVCDIVFPHPNSLSEHIKRHSKCSDCDFEASKRVIGIHQAEKHPKQEEEQIHDDADDAVKVKILPDEEVEAWRSARRRNYPTAEKIAQKQKGTLTESEALARFREETPQKKRKQEQEPKKTKKIKQQQECKKFKNGKCNRGTNCKFIHVVHYEDLPQEAKEQLMQLTKEASQSLN